MMSAICSERHLRYPRPGRTPTPPRPRALQVKDTAASEYTSMDFGRLGWCTVHGCAPSMDVHVLGGDKGEVQMDG
jgi:hypothetical protein